jgi:hypothetical protein
MKFEALDFDPEILLLRVSRKGLAQKMWRKRIPKAICPFLPMERRVNGAQVRGLTWGLNGPWEKVQLLPGVGKSFLAF